MLTGTDPFDNAAPDLSNPDCAEGQITPFSGNLSLSDSMWFSVWPVRTGWRSLTQSSGLLCFLLKMVNERHPRGLLRPW